MVSHSLQNKHIQRERVNAGKSVTAGKPVRAWSYIQHASTKERLAARIAYLSSHNLNMYSSFNVVLRTLVMTGSRESVKTASRLKSQTWSLKVTSACTSWATAAPVTSTLCTQRNRGGAWRIGTQFRDKHNVTGKRLGGTKHIKPVDKK